MTHLLPGSDIKMTRLKQSAKDRKERLKKSEVKKNAKKLLSPAQITALTSKDGPGYLTLKLRKDRIKISQLSTKRLKTHITSLKPHSLPQTVHSKRLSTLIPLASSHYCCSGEDDGKRTAIVVAKKSKRPQVRLLDRAKELFSESFPQLIARDSSHIQNDEACDHQGPHTDGPCNINHSDPVVAALATTHRTLIDKGTVPLSALISLEDGTSLRVWSGSHRLAWDHEAADIAAITEGTIVDLPSHSVCLFRQDLVHAGDGYEVSNSRIHFFLDAVEGKHRYRRKNIKTGEVVTETYFKSENLFVIPSDPKLEEETDEDEQPDGTGDEVPDEDEAVNEGEDWTSDFE